MNNYSCIIPIDLHVHGRTGLILESVIPYTYNNFDSAVMMGNLAEPDGPTDSLEKVITYRNEIMSHVPKNNPFKPIMTVMLTRSLTPEKLHDAATVARVLKFIPGATSTNSSGGISFFELKKSYYPVLKMAEKIGMIFSVHAELIKDSFGRDIPELEREAAAIPFMEDIVHKFPRLKIVFEHVSSRAACDFVKACPDNVAATITLHHLILSKEDVFNTNGEVDNIFNYCKPPAKKVSDREAILKVAFSGHKKFFFGSDSAPHPISAKLNNGAAGVFTAPILVEKLVEIFAKANKLDKLEKFMSINGRKFYGLPIPDQRIEFTKIEHEHANEVNGIRIFNCDFRKLQWRRIV
ncbi:MAG: hypothetical protein WCK37_02005 [Candidatus Falkowbacteria bacterium]